MTFSEKYPRDKSTEAMPQECVGEVLKFWPPDVEEVLAGCDYNSRDELAAAYTDIWMRIASDKYLASKSTQATMPETKLLLQRAQKMCTAADMPKRMAAAADGLWLRRFERLELTRRRNGLFSGEKDTDVYLYALSRIREIYGFSDTEIDALRYFVCQARRDGSDPVLNRALYIYSSEKMTGKTTVAKIVAGVLNGCASWDEVQRGGFLSDIPTELQFATFARPKATRYACVVMDEAFAGKTTAKYYGKFKTAMTSDTCSVEVKFGDRFDIPCARNYIFTSNNDISSVVADESERRMSVIRMKKPEFGEYTALYRMWRDYIVNAPDEDDVAQWYRDTMPEVKGEAGITLDDMCSAFLSPEFLSAVEDFRNGQDSKSVQSLQGGYSVSCNRYQLPFPKYFNDYIHLSFDVRKNGQLVKDAVVRCFGEPSGRQGGRRYYNITQVLNILQDKLNGYDMPTDNGGMQDDELPY